MSTVLKCIWSSITNNIWVSILLLISISVATWVILAVQLCSDMQFNCNYDEKFCGNLNQILLNLSYSYIAGYLFYLFTSWLPALIRSIKMQPVLDAGFNEIKICIHNMYFMFQDMGNIDMNDIDNICKVMSEANWVETVFGPLPNKNRMQYLAHFSRVLNDTLVNFIKLNKDYLSSNDLQKLNEIKDTNPVALYEVMEKAIVNNGNCQPIVEEYKQVLIVAKNYFGNLNAK